MVPPSQLQRPKKASEEELQRCRQNPPLANELYFGVVVCLECGALVKRLVRSPKCHARHAHPGVDYPAKWPTAPLYGKGVHESDLKQHYDWVRDNRDDVNSSRRNAYGRKLEKAEEDPASPEAAFINGERKRTAELWNEQYWGAATPEHVKQLEADAKADPTGPAAKKLEAAEAFRAAEKIRRQQRAPHDNEQAKELLEALKSAAEAVKRLEAMGEPVPPDLQADVDRLEARRKKDREEQRRVRLSAALDNEPQGTRKIVHYLWDHPEAGNEETFRATGTNLSRRQMTRLRDRYGVPGLKGRPREKS